MNTAALAAAAKAYAAQTQAMPKAESAAQGTGFNALLERSLEDVRQIGADADTGMRAQVTGKAEIVDVVTAVAEAELTVQTIVSVRDRMLSAYQEIMRMPI